MAKRHPASSCLRRMTAPTSFVVDGGEPVDMRIGEALRNADRRATPAEIRKIGDVAVLRYPFSLQLQDA